MRKWVHLGWLPCWIPTAIWKCFWHTSRAIFFPGKVQVELARRGGNSWEVNASTDSDAWEWDKEGSIQAGIEVEKLQRHGLLFPIFFLFFYGGGTHSTHSMWECSLFGSGILECGCYFYSAVDILRNWGFDRPLTCQQNRHAEMAHILL